MINKRGLYLILSFILCLTVTGCFSTKYIAHNEYLFNVPKKASRQSFASYKCSIFVEHVVAIPPFDQLDFLYRVKSGQYLVDYYNGFLVAPAEQLNSILIDYLKAYGDFSLVTEPLAATKLQVKLTELYADYYDHNKPQAVVAINFFLTKLIAGKTRVLLDKVLRASVPLNEKSTNSLLQAWNDGIKNILKQGVHLLNNNSGC